MKKQVFILLSIAAMVAASCKGVVEEIAPQEPESKLIQRDFSAVVTKTALSGNQVVWQSGDEISVFAGGTAATGGAEYALKDYNSENPSSSATFTGSIAEATDYYAVYPYLADNAYNGNATLTATVPEEQIITSGSFAPGAAVVVGKADVNYTFPFQNAVALLKVKLGTGMDGASRIEVSGNNGEYIAGAFTATYSSNSFVFANAASGMATTVALNIAGGTFLVDEYYYIAIRPTEFTKGLTARVYFPQGGGAADKVAVKTSEAAVTINAGQILPLGTFTGTSVWAPSLGYGENEIFTLGDTKYVSFNYGDSKEFPVANVDHIDVTGLATGWSASFNSAASKVTVTAPASPDGNYPPTALGLKLISPEGNEATPALNVRLYGIGSVEELKMADHIMQAESGFTVPTGTPAGTIDSYLVTSPTNGQELFLTADLTLATGDLRSSAIAMHHNAYPINGNGRTLTFDNVTVGAWPTGVIQNMLHDVHDLNLSGAITSTYSSASTTNRPLIGALAARAMTNDVVVTNVTSDVDITYSASSSPAFIGGLVGYMSTGNKSITFKECTVSGDIVCNAEVTAIGGIIAQGEGTGTDENAWTTFEDCLWTGTLTYRPDATNTNTTDRRTRIGGIVGNTERQLKAIRTYSRGRIDVYLDNKIFGSSTNDRAIGGWFGRSTAYNSNQPQYHMAFYIDDVRSSTHIYVYGVNANEVRSAYQIRGYGLCARSGPGAANNGNIILENSAAIHYEEYAGPAINGTGSVVSFAYGTSQDIPVTTEDLTDWTITPVAPTGWSVDVAHIKDASPYITVTPPTQADIQAGTAVGAGNIAFNVSNASYSFSPGAGTGQTVRLYGINSKEEFNAFKAIYGDINDTRVTDGFGDYLVNGKITLNSDLTFATSDFYVVSSQPVYVIKWLYDELEGNNRTITFDNVTSAGSICGFFQGIKNDVSRLNFAGTLTSTNGAAEIGVLASRGGYAKIGTSTGATTVSYVNSSTHIISQASAQNTGGKVGGLIGCTGYVAHGAQKLEHCVVSGIIENKNNNTRFMGGFVGGNGSTVDPLTQLDNCEFSGTINYYYGTNNNGCRTGGFLGSNDRQAVINNCTFSGKINAYMNQNKFGSGSYCIGGVVGRTTASTTSGGNTYTMKCEINNFTYSGTITAYDATGTNWMGTCIGADAGFAVTRVDDAQPLTAAGIYNFPGTSIQTGTTN